MFCYKCGKELQENSMFCTWCGTKLEPIPNSATSAPNVPNVPTPSETPRSNLGSVQEQPPVTSDPLSAEPDATSAAYSQPISEMSLEAPQPSPDPAPEPAQPTQPEQPSPESSQTAENTVEVPLTEPQAPEKPPKYYTGAHLAICLVITGIMAAAAGVFAGLYFSAIM